MTSTSETLMKPEPRRIVGFDGLRALSLLAVCLYHFDPEYFPRGITGIDAFFVVSGTVVTVGASGDARPLAFWAKRFARLWPALLVCLTFIAVGSALITWEERSRDSAFHLVAAAPFGLSNVVLAGGADDGYFSWRTKHNAGAHLWSLSIEEQFYFLFPLCFWLLKTRRRTVLLAIFMLVASAVSYAFLQLAALTRNEAHVLLTARFWQLGVGVLIGLGGRLRLEHRLRAPAVAVDPPRPLSLVLALDRALIVFGLLGLIAGWANVQSMGSSTWQTACTAAVCWGLLAQPGGWGVAVLDTRPLRLIGLLSYSGYLWHWPILIFFRLSFGVSTWFHFLLYVVTVVAATALSHRLVEVPGRRRLHLLSPYAILARLMSASVLVAALSLWLGTNHATIRTVFVGATEEPTPQRLLRLPRTPIDPGLPLSGKMLFVFGDSHASFYGATVERIAQRTGIGATTYTHSGCGLATFRYPHSVGCTRIIAASVEAILAAAAPGDIVFLAGRRSNGLGSPVPTPFSIPPTASVRGAKKWEGDPADMALAVAIVRRFQAAGLVVLLDLPKPVFRWSAVRCSTWPGHLHPYCADGLSTDRAELLEHTRRQREAIDALQARAPGITLWDPFPLLCPGPVCHAVAPNGQLIIRDESHLGLAGAALISLSLERAIIAVANQGPPSAATGTY